jgi:hypothetical protein
MGHPDLWQENEIRVGRPPQPVSVSAGSLIFSVCSMPGATQLIVMNRAIIELI